MLRARKSQHLWLMFRSLVNTKTVWISMIKIITVFVSFSPSDFHSGKKCSLCGPLGFTYTQFSPHSENRIICSVPLECFRNIKFCILEKLRMFFYLPNQAGKETTAIGSKSIWILTLHFQFEKTWISCLGPPPVLSLPFPAFPCAMRPPPSAPLVLGFYLLQKQRAWVVQMAASGTAVSWFLPNHVCSEKEKGVLGGFKGMQNLGIAYLLSISQLHWFFMHVTSVWERYRKKLLLDGLVPGSFVCLNSLDRFWYLHSQTNW